MTSCFYFVLPLWLCVRVFRPNGGQEKSVSWWPHSLLPWRAEVRWNETGKRAHASADLSPGQLALHAVRDCLARSLSADGLRGRGELAAGNCAGDGGGERTTGSCRVGLLLSCASIQVPFDNENLSSSSNKSQHTRRAQLLQLAYRLTCAFLRKRRARWIHSRPSSFASRRPAELASRRSTFCSADSPAHRKKGTK